MLDAATIDCPYCGEPIEILLEPSEDSQRYIEDCQVCCRPITVSVTVDEHGGTRVDASPEDDA
jgi:hypothetical protein